MFCGQCGSQADGHFCIHCGTRIDKPSPLPDPTVALPSGARSLEPSTEVRARSAALGAVLAYLKASRVRLVLGLAALVLAVVSVTIVSSRGADPTTDPLYKVGYRDASHLSIYPGNGQFGPVCSAYIRVSDAADSNWASDDGRRAYYNGCIAGFSDKWGDDGPRPRAAP